MDNLGDFLKQQRQEKNVSLEEVAFRTRIPVRFIRAIEENQFELLPNHVSAKGFLKSYSRALGLDESAVLKLFSDSVKPGEEAPPAEKKEEIPSYIQIKQPDRLPFPLWATVSVAGVIALLVVLLMVMPKNTPQEEISPPGDPPAAAPPPENEPAAPPTGELPPDPGAPALEPPNETQPTPQPAPSPSSAPVPPLPPAEVSKPLVLALEAVEPSWIQVTIDGTETKEALLQPSEKIRWEAKEKFMLTVGNAGGIRAVLDGQDLGLLGPSGKVIRKEFPPRVKRP